MVSASAKREAQTKAARSISPSTKPPWMKPAKFAALGIINSERTAVVSAARLADGVEGVGAVAVMRLL